MAIATPNSGPIKVRTAGALRAGIAGCAEAYRAKTRQTFVTSFTHGPAIEKELEIRTCDADIVGLTRDAIDAAHRKGALLVATDGYRMLVLHDEAGRCSKSAIVPVAFSKAPVSA